MDKEWAACDPVLLQGFLSRHDADQMLRGQARRTFLLRVSESRDGCLVASFVADSGALAHCLISLADGKVSIALGTKKHDISHYDSLRKLVTDSRNLSKLCPCATDKKLAFAQLD